MTFVIFILFLAITVGISFGYLIHKDEMKLKESLKRLQDHNLKVKTMIASGQYEVYVDGNSVERPDVLDVERYSITIDEKKHIISLTRLH